MITFQEITLQRGKKVLFDKTSATIFAKQKVGVIGVNGSGKSSLFALLLGKITLDGGEIYLQSNISIAHLSQEVPNTAISALQYVMNGDVKIFELIERLRKAETVKDDHQVVKLHNRLYEVGGYNLESRAAKILIGLGFNLEEQQKPVNSFSGGWRMRLNLAQVLMNQADLMLLDEPTNYLDMDAIVWLEKWLQDYSGTLLLISHDRDFLDNVIEKTLYIGNQKLELYLGNYSSFELQRAEKLAQERSLYEKQQRKIEHLNKYINRFRAKATKARQAQSRIKMLEKMEKVSITHINSPFSFKFSKTSSCGNPLISLSKVDVGYGDHNVLSKINFGMAPQEAIGILGINGAGKSTFMKTLAGILQPQNGSAFFNKDLKIGYFAQHQVDQLDMDCSPVEHILELDFGVSEQRIRTFLGGFGFKDEMAFGSVRNFSGGEKARFVLAILIWQKPNLLLLDEPTNHLDLEMREALTYALQDYEGALVLVAHDRYLLKATVDEFYLVNDGKVEKFNGDLDDYQRWLLDIRKQRLAKCEKEKGEKPKTHSTQNIKKIDKKKLHRLEKEINKLQVEKEQLAILLSDAEMYKDESKVGLEKHLKRSAKIEEQLKILEEQWLEGHG
jgi:ATP-binding cassette subfamily F protein 3